jgi:hypothetical protein
MATEQITEQSVASAGTFIGASLEALGYQYQSFILEDLGKFLIGPIGTLIFVGGLVWAFGMVILTGRWATLKWYLLGPALFFSVITYTTETKGPVWRFASFDKDQARVEREVKNQLRNATGTVLQSVPEAKVSSLFHGFNRITSTIFRSFEMAILATREKFRPDLSFIITQQLASEVRDKKVPDPGLRSLIQDILFGQCQGMIDRAAEIRNAFSETGSRPAAEQGFVLERKKKVSLGKEGSPSLNYAKSMYAGYDLVKSRIFILDPNVTELANELARRLSGNNAKLTPTEATSSDYITRANEFDSTDNSVIQNTDCRHVWALTYFGLVRYADEVRGKAEDTCKQNGLNVNVCLQDLLMVKNINLVDSNPGDTNEQRNATLVNAVTRVIAHFILQNEIDKNSPAAYMREVSKRNFEVGGLVVDGENDLSFIERTRNKSWAYGYKKSIISTAMTLPYWQGVALYFLAMMFPFFALLLLIPGKYGGFIYWFLLWIWVKSWDAGFAVVMVLDSVLKDIFQPNNVTGEFLNKVTNPEPDIAFAKSAVFALRTLDPTFELGTYYAIIGSSLAAIPIITSYIVLRTASYGASIVQGATEEFSDIIRDRLNIGMMEQPKLYTTQQDVGRSGITGIGQNRLNQFLGNNNQNSANQDYAVNQEYIDPKTGKKTSTLQDHLNSPARFDSYSAGQGKLLENYQENSKNNPFIQAPDDYEMQNELARENRIRMENGDSKTNTSMAHPNSTNPLGPDGLNINNANNLARMTSQSLGYANGIGWQENFPGTNPLPDTGVNVVRAFSPATDMTAGSLSTQGKYNSVKNDSYFDLHQNATNRGMYAKMKIAQSDANRTIATRAARMRDIIFRSVIYDRNLGRQSPVEIMSDVMFETAMDQISIAAAEDSAQANAMPNFLTGWMNNRGIGEIFGYAGVVRGEKTPVRSSYGITNYPLEDTVVKFDPEGRFNNNEKNPTTFTVLQAKPGSVIKSSGDGYIFYRGKLNKRGNTIMILHDDDSISILSNLEEFTPEQIEKAENFERVSQTNTIGQVSQSNSLTSNPGGLMISHIVTKKDINNTYKLYWSNPEPYLEGSRNHAVNENNLQFMEVNESAFKESQFIKDKIKEIRTKNLSQPSQAPE